MYPLSMSLIVGVGFAVANDEAEHAALTAGGYGPAFVPAPAPIRSQADDAADANPDEADTEGHTVASVRAALDEAGVKYDKRLGLDKLKALLPA